MAISWYSCIHYDTGAGDTGYGSGTGHHAKSKIYARCAYACTHQSLTHFVSHNVCVILCVFCVFLLLVGQGPEIKIKWNMNKWVSCF